MEKIESITKEALENKKIKNLISIVILLGGLFVGSLFVDIAQLLSGNGFSERNLSRSEIFEAKEKTWVAYSEPIVDVKVISDETCENCDPSEALVWLRRVMPTISAQKINYDSEEGKKIIEDKGLKTLPAFIFSDEVAKTDFYLQALVLFEEKDGWYVLKTQELGLNPGKYLTTPKINEGDATAGPADAKVKMVIFSDFQCPYCRLFWLSLREVMKEYGERVLFDYKHLPLDIHPQANNAALASECALGQNKFWEYGDKLFSDQSEWSTAEGTQKFKDYAQSIGLDTNQFNACLDSKKDQEKIDASVKEAGEFGISGTPAIFINSQFKNGVTSVDDLKATIDQEMAK